MIPLEKIESFMRLLYAVQNVERTARIPNETKRRNTAEHTFELALLCWYIVDVEKLNLDLSKVLRYALAHDLLEAYAGDTYIYDVEAQKTKHERETKAIKEIETRYGEFEDLIQAIHTYEKREDAESRFVYAMDKINEPLNRSMEEKETLWNTLDVYYEQLRENKDPKVALSPLVVPYWEAIAQKLEARKDFYFGKRRDT